MGVLKSRKIFGPKRGEVTGKWSFMIFMNFMICAAHNFIRVTKSIKMRWAGHVARMGERRGAYRVSVGRPERKTPVPMTEA